MIGAGSTVFARRLMTDILSWPELADTTIALMDIDPSRLRLVEALARQLVKQHSLAARIEATTDRRAALDGADYVVVGTIFESPSHPGAAPGGIRLLEDVVARLSIPVVAIGGITPENARACWAAGASGIAVVSTILGADDPRRAAERLVPGSE